MKISMHTGTYTFASVLQAYKIHCTQAGSGAVMSFSTPPKPVMTQLCQFPKASIEFVAGSDAVMSFSTFPKPVLGQKCLSRPSPGWFWDRNVILTQLWRNRVMLDLPQAGVDAVMPFSTFPKLILGQKCHSRPPRTSSSD